MQQARREPAAAADMRRIAWKQVATHLAFPPALFPFLDVLRNVEFGLKMRGTDKATRRRKAMDWLERLGIAEFSRRDISQLSGGQRQRVALARSLVTEPEILLLDEPLSSLDAHLKVRMQAILSGLQKDLGITFVYVTHSQSEAFSMGDRIVIMSRGRIEQIGAPVEIYRTPHKHFVAEFLGSSNIFRGRMVSVDGGLVSIETGRGRFRVTDSGEGKPFITLDNSTRYGARDAHARASGCRRHSCRDCLPGLGASMVLAPRDSVEGAPWKGAG